MRCRQTVEVKLTAKAMDEVRELKNLVEEFKTNAIEMILILTIFRKGMTSCMPFSKRPKKTLWRSSKLPTSLPSFWTGTTLLALKTSI